MEQYYESVDGAGAWQDQINQRRRFISSGSNAYLNPAFNACTGSPIGGDSSLLRYTRSSSRPPLPPSASDRSPIHQLLHLRSSTGPPPGYKVPVYKTPVKLELEEDVLVMDGVLVTQPEKIRRTRTPDEFGLPATILSSGSNSLYQEMMRRQWEESGSRSMGSKSQVCNSASSAESGVYVGESAPAGSAESTTAGDLSTAAEVDSFVCAPTEAEEKHMNEVLYGRSGRRRLPVFVEICQE